jgi:hypothetical protein
VKKTPEFMKVGFLFLYLLGILHVPKAVLVELLDGARYNPTECQEGPRRRMSLGRLPAEAMPVWGFKVSLGVWGRGKNLGEKILDQGLSMSEAMEARKNKWAK